MNWEDNLQELLDRGWRRSGCFLYKPEMERTCCPSYTIRLKVEDFSPSKEQARVQKKMQRFLDGTLDVKKPEQVKLTQDSSKSRCMHADASPTTVPNAPVSESSSSSSSDKISSADPYLHYLEKKIDDALSTPALLAEFPIIQVPKAIVKRVTSQAKRKISNVTEDLLYTSNISFQVAAALRRSLLTEDDGQSGLSRSSASQHGNLINFSPNTVAEKLAVFINGQGDIHGLSIKACSGHLNFYSTTKLPGTDFLSSEACAHSDGKRVNPKRSCMSGGGIGQHHKRRRLEIRMKRSSFDPEEFALYRRYQIKVHNDKPEKVSESSYRRFLVDTPLVFVPPISGNETVPHCGLGSFHQQYLIDGKLVAVGVVDILPRCLSSKYLFWDPEFSFLSLGKYSALQEINWVKEAGIHCPGLQYYYLGYYIHSCSKMRYKAAYHPSELLCPLRYKWVPFYIARPLLDEKPYVVLSDFTAQSDGFSNQFTDGLSSQSELRSEDDDLNEASSEEDDSDDNEPGIEGTTVGTEAELVVETGTTLASDDLGPVDLSNIMIDLNGLRIKYKELEHVVGPIDKMHQNLLEKQLHRYVKVVGEKLANHVVYTLG
ncbi:Arginyltransferase protein [Dioscorea alata]|uniref:Arginyltransferase protein n=2 Tax=Dioscorea alata TaxID=55571 RepID=A0ACB7VGM6_DIOAL|nr:Arginyltransferase protein [Dioscorea alata]